MKTIKVSEENKKLLRNLNASLEKAELQLQMMQLQVNNIKFQKEVLLSAIINEKKHTGTTFNLTQDLDLVEVVEEKAKQNGLKKAGDKVPQKQK